MKDSGLAILRHLLPGKGCQLVEEGPPDGRRIPVKLLYGEQMRCDTNQDMGSSALIRLLSFKTGSRRRNRGIIKAEDDG
jgi:hypothetical protein